MEMKKRKIVIVSHEKHELQFSSMYLLRFMRERWLSDGHEVQEICGISQPVTGDLAFVHVDLSVVPDEYLAFAKKFPSQVNANINDIRKTRYSQGRVTKDSSYSGSVIVKSILNSGGHTEHFLADKDPKYAGGKDLQTGQIKITGNGDYLIFPSLQEVPPEVFQQDGLIVEKFQPEMHDGHYCLREWHFCGTAGASRVEISKDPIFTSGISAQHLAQPPPAELVEIRKKLGIDYGKMDYVIRDGKPILFDVNKTTGISPDGKSDGVSVDEELGSILAEGLYSFFKG